jgi:hypothetical protein
LSEQAVPELAGYRLRLVFRSLAARSRISARAYPRTGGDSPGSSQQGGLSRLVPGFGLDAQQAVKLAIDIQDAVLAVMRAD